MSTHRPQRRRLVALPPVPTGDDAPDIVAAARLALRESDYADPRVCADALVTSTRDEDLRPALRQALSALLVCLAEESLDETTLSVLPNGLDEVFGPASNERDSTS